jgi:anaerobic dimethyl sulfoxide reductase subunit A
LNRIRRLFMGRHAGETTVYTSCYTDGCGNVAGACPLKVHVKDGVMTGIEAGDIINQGMFREDVSEDAIRAEMIQHRPCSRAYSWRRTINHPDRAKYPMKSVGERGERRFTRISWDEALDTVVAKIREIGGKYGPHCILGELPVIEWGGRWGIRTWGMSSFSGYILPDLVTLGYCSPGIAVTDNEAHEFTDIFNSRLILWFGHNPAITEHGSVNWFMRAKEKGIPIIIVDPIYTISAEVYADQWIPIRPNTDLAMLLAMANVLLRRISMMQIM